MKARLTVTFVLLIAGLIILQSCVPDLPQPDNPQETRYPVTLTVSGRTTGCDTLEQAFEAAPGGQQSVITVYKDVVLSRQLTVAGKSVTLTDGGSDVTITRAFSSDSGNRMFVITDGGSLTLRGSTEGSLTVDGSRAEASENLSGRNVFLVGTGENDSTASLSLLFGVTVRNNVTSAKGGAALVNGTLTLDGAVVEHNTSSDNGGAFQISYNGTLKVFSGTIRSNSANYGGGVNAARTTTVLIAGGSFENNTATTGGGNLYIPSQSQGVTICGGSFTGGKLKNDANSIDIANGSADTPTSVNITGSFSCDMIQLKGKNIRLNLCVSPGATTWPVKSTVDLSTDEKLALLAGPFADEYGCLRFEGLPESMFGPSDDACARFFATPINQKEWGDCTYIEFPDGTNMLIDAAQTETGEAIAKELWACGIRRIDAVLLTHFHGDHANGLKPIIQNAGITIGTLYCSTYRPSASYSWLIGGVTSVSTVSKGSSFSLGGATFDVLWPDQSCLNPPAGYTSNSTDSEKAYTADDPPPVGGSLDVNSRSLVVRMVYKNTTILFTGDIYANGISYGNRDYTAYDNLCSEQYLVAEYAGTQVLNADIMTAPHHGKRTSSSVALIEAVSPVWAIAMGGNYQSDVAQRYADAGAHFILTGSTVTDFSDAANADVLVRIGERRIKTGNGDWTAF
ncbi:MAG: MBL fold metallo-hydrolase [Spirochaetales bacterium]|nr:MBL fold metallo-hydrolase [Spirochaetales bacterium]